MKQIGNENAVFSVASVILMIAISVILAAAIAYFVFGMSPNIEKVPSRVECGCVAVTPAPTPVPNETVVSCGCACDCGCKTKTSILHVKYKSTGVFTQMEYVEDSNGNIYSWNSGSRPYSIDEIDGHNVTFVYDSCKLSLEYPTYLRTVGVHPDPCCGCSCGCKS